MKISNSMCWLMRWAFLLIALIAVIVGIFTLPANISTGAGALLLGVLGVAFMAWRLRYDNSENSSKQRWGIGLAAGAGTVLGIFLIVAGGTDPLIPVQGASDEESTTPPPSSSNISDTPSNSAPITNTSTLSPSTVVITSTVQLEPAPVTVTSSIAVEPEKLTTTLTIYVPSPQPNRQVPMEPVPVEPATPSESLTAVPQQQTGESFLEESADAS